MAFAGSIGKIFFIIFWNFAKLSYRLDSPQVKQNLVSSMKTFEYGSPRELQNDLRN